LIFKTISGSIYELNQEEKKIRRLYGLSTGSKRTGQDGEWKQYEDILPDNIIPGRQVIIIWSADKVNGESVLRATETSLVKEIVKEEEMS